MNLLGEITASAPLDREAIERELVERVRARGSAVYVMDESQVVDGAPFYPTVAAGPAHKPTELDVFEQALSRVGEKVTRYDGRFAPHNVELSIRTVPGGAIDLVFDNEGKLLSIARRHCVIE